MYKNIILVSIITALPLPLITMKKKKTEIYDSILWWMIIPAHLIFAETRSPPLDARQTDRFVATKLILTSPILSSGMFCSVANIFVQKILFCFHDKNYKSNLVKLLLSDYSIIPFCSSWSCIFFKYFFLVVKNIYFIFCISH